MKSKFLAVFSFWLALIPARAQVGSSPFPHDLTGGALEVSPGIRVGPSVVQRERNGFPGGRAHFSLSGQFIIHDPPHTDRTFLNPYNPSAPGLVQLEPTLLAVSSERIKKAFLTALEARDQWRGRVYVDLHPARSLDETILVTSFLSGGQWNYSVQLPDALEISRLVSVIVQVLLLEMANRNPGNSAELPLWLAEGLSRQIILASDADLVLEAPKRSWYLNSVSWRKANPLARAHDELRDLTPLTLGELGWPRPEQLDGEAGEAYRSSAQLFVNELLRLPRGPACLRAFVENLPRHLNWQISFLEAFHSQFANQLELEKWWTLRLVDFTGRDLSQLWPGEESWRKVDEIIRPPVQIRTGADELPLRSEVTLQTIIRDWEFFRQNRILQEKLQQLFLLRLKVSQDLVPLVDGYRRTLETYLRRREKDGVSPMGRAPAGRNINNIIRDTLQQLDALDGRREELRPRPKPAKTETAAIPTNH